MSKSKGKRVTSGIVLFALAAAILFVSACSAEPSSEASVPAQNDQSAFDWGIQVKSSLVTADLSTTQEVQQYGGEITQAEYQSKPGDGNVYLLLELSIEKQASGATRFAWENLSVEDAAGNGYSRLENDTFLETFGYGRIKSVDLTLGKNEGFACFEIPSASSEGELYLVYEDPGGENRIKIQ